MNFNFNFSFNLNRIRNWLSGSYIAWSMNMLKRTSAEAREAAEAKNSAIAALATSRLKDIEVATHADEVHDAVSAAIANKKLVS